MYLRGWRVFYTVRLQKTLWNLHLDIGSQHNCFANSLQRGITGATGFSPYSLMKDLIFGHGKKQATKKALNKHPAELQKCPVLILTWPKLHSLGEAPGSQQRWLAASQVGKRGLLFLLDGAKRERGVWSRKVLRNSLISQKNVPTVLIL